MVAYRRIAVLSLTTLLLAATVCEMVRSHWYGWVAGASGHRWRLSAKSERGKFSGAISWNTGKEDFPRDFYVTSYDMIFPLLTSRPGYARKFGPFRLEYSESAIIDMSVNSVPYWLLSAIAGTITIVLFRRWYRVRQRAAEHCCRNCHYDLRGSTEAGRCPECGTAIDESQLAQLQQTAL